MLHELARRYPPDRDSPQPEARALRSLRPEVVTEPTDEVVDGYVHDAGHLELVRALGARSVMAVPMFARDYTVGAVTLASGSRIYAEEDVALAQELAQRRAQAVDNARLYEAQVVAIRRGPTF